MPTLINISQTIDPPKCKYKIADDSKLETSVKHVRVGDKVEHVWSCESALKFDNEQKLSEQFGILIHNCFVDDGRGRKEKIVDDRG